MGQRQPHLLPDIGGNDQKFLRSKQRPPEVLGTEVLRIVDLFSGCGGMTLGAIEAARSLGCRVEIALAMEIDSHIRAIYDANFNSVVSTLRENVADRFDCGIGKSKSFIETQTAREVGSVDLLLGGPPCQGHSNLNNHTRRNDPKNALYLRMLRAVEVLRPASVVIENVPEIKHASNHAVPRVMKVLATLGYAAVQTEIAAVDLGVPQLRTRHVIVATRRPIEINAQSIEKRGGRIRSLRWAIGDIVDDPDDGLFFAASQLSGNNLRRAKYLHRYGKFDLPNEQRPDCHRDKPNHKYKSMYGRLAWSKPAQTITTGFGSPGQGRYLHPKELRTITPHEAARLQFFPDWFDFSSAKYRRVLAESIGNAVPPKMSFCLSRGVLRAVLAARAQSAKQAA